MLCRLGRGSSRSRRPGELFRLGPQLPWRLAFHPRPRSPLSLPCPRLPPPLDPSRCGHCKKLKPELEKAAQLLDVNIGTVDATNNRDLAVRFGVHGYPTVFHINEDGEVRFAGVRSVQAIRSFVTTQYKHVDPMPYWTSPMNPM